ncbi:unnamed protein product, partial [Musa textilis]
MTRPKVSPWTSPRRRRPCRARRRPAVSEAGGRTATAFGSTSSKPWVSSTTSMPLGPTTWSTSMIGGRGFSDGRTARYRKQLKSKIMQRCISNGVRFHQAKVVKVIHEETKS